MSHEARDRATSLTLEAIKTGESAEVLGKVVLIWSREHRLWWRENACGYTAEAYRAGLFTYGEAMERSSHCGPEKGIEYFRADQVLARLRVVAVERLSEIDRMLHYASELEAK